MSTTDFLVIIKPDGIRRGLVGEIITRFERKGFCLSKMKLLHPDQSKDFVSEHYSQHREMGYYAETVEFVLSGPIVVMVWNGNINVASQSVVGPTIPWEASPGTIRGDFTSTMPANLIHCSRDSVSANREVKLWTPVF